jgi:hypothetical protein
MEITARNMLNDDVERKRLWFFVELSYLLLLIVLLFFLGICESQLAESV